MNEQAELAALRAEFPRWGILHIPFGQRWVAIRSGRRLVVADSAEELRYRLRNL